MPESDSKTSKSNNSNLPAPISKYMLTAEDCAELFGTAEPVASLDLHLINRCGENETVKIPAAAMSADGVTFSYAFEGDTLTSASPSTDFYRMTNASVNISFTLRLATIANQIRSMVLPGVISQQGSGSNQITKQVVNRSMLRRRPSSLVLVAVAEDEPANPEQAEGGGFIFGNTSIDYSQNIDLNYNPNDPVEIPVQMVARFTRGVEGVLAEMYY